MKNIVRAKDVAKEAGVTAATVSYVLNGKSSVTISAETQDRVWSAVKKLGYVPNQAAKTLSSSRSTGYSRSNLIGVVIPQTEPGKKFMFSNPFYGEFLSALEYGARLEGYHLLVSGVNLDQSYIEIAKNRSLDGIIILGMYPSDEIQEYKRSGIPSVMVDCYCDNDHYFHSVRTDDRYGGYLATEYLIKKGHRRIAFVSGEAKEAGVNHMRFLGYQDALEEYEIPSDERLVINGYIGYEFGIEAAERIVDSNNGITAVFATADIIAVGMVKGFRKRGVRIPQDISIIGFDDIYASVICDPSITTIRQNIEDKGTEVAKLIVAAAQNRKYPKKEIIIPIEIIERESVRKL
ncbi:LacI family transcriptional regulator [Anaerotaenia torta]|uniref:LacI family DNA-binding transcriptional regulator n=1 Tax=Anaerotaenia torta TaxID=433293 RepID=UPI003D191892